MSQLEIVFLVIVITAIDLWILYAIIKSATQSNKISKLLQKQNDILTRLLEHQGGSLDRPSPLLDANKKLENQISLNDPKVLEDLLKALNKKE